MNKRLWVAVYAFAGFSIALAVKDVLFVLAMRLGSRPYQMLFGVGIAMLLVLLALWLRNTEQKISITLANQLPRLILNIVSWPALVLSLRYLDATTLNVLNKATIPVTMLIGVALGVTYQRQEKVLALMLVVLCLAYAIFLVLVQGYQVVGMACFVLALVAISGEFVLLAKNSQHISGWQLGITPSISMVIGAFVLYIMDGAPELQWPSAEYGQEMLVGSSFIIAAAMTFVYVFSPVRYKILPPGLAEFPSIFSFLLIYASEIILINRRFSVFEAGSAIAILVVTIYLIAIRKKYQVVKSLGLNYAGR
ncbi:hypothetical protein [Pseudomonas nicosulfuronedens]